jgi:hypothetical protein
MKKLVIVSLLAGLYAINSQANDNRDDFWFPNEQGSYIAESAASNETNNAKILHNENVVTDDGEVLLRNRFQGTRQYRSRIVRPKAETNEANESSQGSTESVEGDKNSSTIDKIDKKPRKDMHTRRPYKLHR